MAEYNGAVRSEDVDFNPNVKDGRGTRRPAGQQDQLGQHASTSRRSRPTPSPAASPSPSAGCGSTTDAQVLDDEGAPIPGLFAAGEMVGGLFYFNYPGGSGLTNGTVLGRLAGSTAGARASGAG